MLSTDLKNFSSVSSAGHVANSTEQEFSFAFWVFFCCCCLFLFFFLCLFVFYFTLLVSLRICKPHLILKCMSTTELTGIASNFSHNKGHKFPHNVESGSVGLILFVFLYPEQGSIFLFLRKRPIYAHLNNSTSDSSFCRTPTG